MLTIKKYTREGFVAITQLGSAYFYVILVIFLLTINKKILALYLTLGLLACYILSIIVRLFYFKDRPEKEDFFNFFTKINASSFPSVHMMTSIYAAVVIANDIKILSVSIFLGFVSLLIGYSRIYLKKHYFIDIFFGFVLGLIASIIYLLIFYI